MLEGERPLCVCRWGGGWGVRASDSTWVGNHDDDAVGAVSDNLRDNVLEDVDVSLDEVQPALSLLLTDSGRHHHDAGVCCHRVV